MPEIAHRKEVEAALSKVACEKFGGYDDGSGRIRVDNHEIGFYYDRPETWGNKVKHELKSFKTEASACPRCKKVLDATTEPGHGQSPSPGDFSICLYCGAPLRFTETLGLREVKVGELLQLSAEELEIIKRMQEVVAEVRGKMNEKRTPPA